MFDCVLCGDKVAHPKPAADILEQILKKFSLTPDEVLYVGDMTVDVETGNNAGIRTIAVVTGSSTKEELASLKPFKIIDRVSRVAQIVEDLRGRGSSPTSHPEERSDEGSREILPRFARQDEPRE